MTDELGHNVLWAILVYKHPEPIKTRYLHGIYGNEKATETALTALGDKVWQDGGFCGLSEKEGNRWK